MYFIRISDPAYCVNTFEHVTEETPPLFSVEDIKKLQMDYVEVYHITLNENCHQPGHLVQLQF